METLHKGQIKLIIKRDNVKNLKKFKTNIYLHLNFFIKI